MSTTLASEGILAQVGWNYQDVLNLGNSLQNNSFRFQPTQFSNGTGANGADRVIASDTNIAANAAITVNFSSFTDFWGNAGLQMARVKFMYVELVSTANGANAVNFGGGGATNPLANWISPSTANVQIHKGNPFFLPTMNDSAGYSVTANSKCEVKITNVDPNGNVANVRYVFMGASA